MNKNEIFFVKKNKLYKDKESRIFYFDYLRIVSSFYVILIHVSAEYYINSVLNSYNWKIAYFYNGISRFSVPNFFMISGALFLNRDLSFDNILKKYIKRLFTHLILWSLIYSFVNLNISNLDIKTKLFEIMRGHYHLWYLFATIGLYINIPFLREIIKNKYLLKNFLFLYFLFLFIIPNYIEILPFYSKDIYELLNYLNSVFNLNSLSIYNFYFIIGYYLNIKKITKINRMIIYIIGLFSLFFTTIISHNFSIIIKTKYNFFEPKFLNIFFFSVSIFLFFKSNFNNLKINKINNNIIEKIAKLTFGIYLVHPLIH